MVETKNHNLAVKFGCCCVACLALVLENSPANLQRSNLPFAARKRSWSGKTSNNTDAQRTRFRSLSNPLNDPFTNQLNFPLTRYGYLLS